MEKEDNHNHNMSTTTTTTTKIIEVCGKKYRTQRAHVMLVTTQLVDAETGIPVKGVNLTQKEELIKQGFDFIGFGPVGYWGKLEV